MQYLVTGANGFIGAALVQRLRQAGHGVLAVTRRGEQGRPGVDFQTGNVPAQWLDGIDVVVHCAAIAHTRASQDAYQRVNCAAVLELARLAAAAGVGCFVFLSSVKAAQPVDAYGHSKHHAEQALAGEFAAGPMAVVILRPSLVYGPGVKANLAELVRAVRRGLPTPPAGGARSLIDRDDLCVLIEAVSALALTGVHRFTVSDGERYDLRRLHRAICLALHREPAPGWLPRPAWWLACKLRDLLRGEWGGEGSYARLFGDEYFECDVALPGLEWQPSHSFESRLPDMLQT